MTDFLSNEPLGGVAPRPIPQTVEDPTIAHLKAQLAAMQQEQPVREIPQPAPPAPQVDPAVQQVMAELAALKAQNQQVQTLPEIEAATTLKPKKNWLLIGAGCALLLFVILPMLLGISYVLVNQIWSDDGGDGKPAVVDVDTVNSSNPGEYYIRNLAGGLANACSRVIEKAEANEFNDLGDVESFYGPMVSEVRGKSLAPFKEQVFDQLNGENFSNDKTAELFTKLRQGYLEAVE